LTNRLPAPTVGGQRAIAWFREVQQLAPAADRLTPHNMRLLGPPGRRAQLQDGCRCVRGSVHTAAFHMKNIYAKLQVHSKAEAVAKALRDRIVQ
jgi:hypothetical protein